MLKFFKNEHSEEKVPDNFVIKCRYCEATHLASLLAKNYYICPDCDEPLTRTSYQVVEQVVDIDSFRQMFQSKKIVNPINFPDYEQKQESLKESLDVDESVICGVAKIESMPCAIAVMDTRFLMGSLGTRTGEKICLLVEYATRKKLPLIIFTASGGARMQEGLLSLMQMSKIVSCLKIHNNHGLFYMPILMNPTTGGVSASFASLGDVIVAEEKALICFAGPKVIESTINQKLPEGFQRAEFLYEKGFVDIVTSRAKERELIAKMLKIHGA